MARRQARRSGARQPEPPPRRASASGGWKHWLIIAFVSLMAVILIVTMLPPM